MAEIVGVEVCWASCQALVEIVVVAVCWAFCAVAGQDRAGQAVIGAGVADIGGSIMQTPQRTTANTRLIIVHPTHTRFTQVHIITIQTWQLTYFTQLLLITPIIPTRACQQACIITVQVHASPTLCAVCGDCVAVQAVGVAFVALGGVGGGIGGGVVGLWALLHADCEIGDQFVAGCACFADDWAVDAGCAWVGALGALCGLARQQWITVVQFIIDVTIQIITLLTSYTTLIIQHRR